MDLSRYAIQHDEGSLEWLFPEVEERKLELPKKFESIATNEFIASTDKVARDGDIIDQDTWRLGHYKRNPVVLDGHFGPVVGRSVVVAVVDKQLRAAVQWDDADDNPTGKLIARQHRQGFRRAVSVRWRGDKKVRRDKLPEDDPRFSKGKKVETGFGPVTIVGRVHFNSDLLEISSVGVPSDPYALQTRGLADEDLQALHRGRKAEDAPLARDIEQLVKEAVSRTVEERLGDDTFLATLLDTIARSLPDHDGLRRAIAGRVLDDVRSSEDLRTALRAVGLLDAPRKPFTPSADGLDFLFQE